MTESIGEPQRGPGAAEVDRERMRASGLRLVQLWVPDTRAPGFADACRAQAAAIAADDRAGEEIMRLVETAYQWPEPRSDAAIS